MRRGGPAGSGGALEAGREDAAAAQRDLGLLGRRGDGGGSQPPVPVGLGGDTGTAAGSGVHVGFGGAGRADGAVLGAIGVVQQEQAPRQLGLGRPHQTAHLGLPRIDRVAGARCDSVPRDDHQPRVLLGGQGPQPFQHRAHRSMGVGGVGGVGGAGGVGRRGGVEDLCEPGGREPGTGTTSCHPSPNSESRPGEAPSAARAAASCSPVISRARSEATATTGLPASSTACSASSCSFRTASRTRSASAPTACRRTPA